MVSVLNKERNVSAGIQKITDIPTRTNTVMHSEQINTRPVFVNKTEASKLFGVSKSTIYRWCTEAIENQEWKDIFIRPSSKVLLIHVDTMERYIRSKNNEFL